MTTTERHDQILKILAGELNPDSLTRLIDLLRGSSCLDESEAQRLLHRMLELIKEGVEDEILNKACDAIGVLMFFSESQKFILQLVEIVKKTILNLPQNSKVQFLLANELCWSSSVLEEEDLQGLRQFMRHDLVHLHSLRLPDLTTPLQKFLEIQNLRDEFREIADSVNEQLKKNK